MENKEPNIIYLNSEELDVDSSLLQSNWEIVNAPKPIPGEVVWQGKYRHGTFYAAGKKEVFGRMWHYLDARLCKLVSN